MIACNVLAVKVLLTVENIVLNINVPGLKMCLILHVLAVKILDSMMIQVLIVLMLLRNIAVPLNHLNHVMNMYSHLFQTFVKVNVLFRTTMKRHAVILEDVTGLESVIGHHMILEQISARYTVVTKHCV